LDIGSQLALRYQIQIQLKPAIGCNVRKFVHKFRFFFPFFTLFIVVSYIGRTQAYMPPKETKFQFPSKLRIDKLPKNVAINNTKLIDIVTEIVIALVILKTVHFTLLYNMFR
jgi:hypothetical protein